MGCGLVFADVDVPDKRKPTKVIAYFTKNGTVVHHRSLDQPMGGFYPTIGLACQGMNSVENEMTEEPSVLLPSHTRSAECMQRDPNVYSQLTASRTGACIPSLQTVCRV